MWDLDGKYPSYRQLLSVLKKKEVFLLQFLRTVGSDLSKGPAVIAIMEHYEWRRCVVWTSADTVWLTMGLELTKQLQNSTMDVFKVGFWK